MQLAEILAALRRNKDFMRQVVAWERLAARPAQFDLPAVDLPAAILDGLRARGVTGFFTHQAAAITAVSQSQNVVIATATASGKSLCYTVPVL
ncbi:MAG: hypothetical protein KC421_08770, partial [Anaerolineales bacterium]|nr:hypothetical protein [Anaerolineales bacterium]